MAAKVTKGIVFEGGSFVLLARILGADGEPVVQASFTNIKYEVWSIPVPLEERRGDWTTKFVNVDIPANEVNETAMVIADVIFDTLQTDDRWTVDTTGYNFAFEAPAATLPASDLEDYPQIPWYNVVVKFTPAVGEVFFAQFNLQAVPNLFGK